MLPAQILIFIAGPIGLGASLWLILKMYGFRTMQYATAVFVGILVLFSVVPIVQAAETYDVGFQGVGLATPFGAYVWNASTNRQETISTEYLELAYDMETTTGVRLFDFSGRDHLGTMYGGSFFTQLFTEIQADEDTYVREASPGSSAGSAIFIDVRQKTDPPDGGDVERAYVHIDLSSLPADAVITSAELFVTVDFTTLEGTLNIRAYRVTSSWDEATLNWTTQPTIDTGSFVTESFVPSSTNGTWDITTFAQNWHSGAWSNYGVSLRAQPESCDPVECNSPEEIRFHSSEAATPSNRPLLDLDYSANVTSPSIPLVDGAYGIARDFDGMDDYIDTGLDIPPDRFSLIAWIEADTLVSADNSITIISKRDTGGSNREWTLVARPSDGAIRFFAYESGGGTSLALTSTITISTGIEYGIGLSFNGFSASLWIDGSQRGSANRTASVAQNTDITIKLGAEDNDPDRYWDGPIDEVLIFTEDLPDGTMQWLTTPATTRSIGSPTGTTPFSSVGLQALVVWAAVAMVVLWLGLILWGSFSGLRGAFKR